MDSFSPSVRELEQKLTEIRNTLKEGNEQDFLRGLREMEELGIGDEQIAFDIRRNAKNAAEFALKFYMVRKELVPLASIHCPTDEEMRNFDTSWYLLRQVHTKEVLKDLRPEDYDSAQNKFVLIWPKSILETDFPNLNELFPVDGVHRTVFFNTDLGKEKLGFMFSSGEVPRFKSVCLHPSTPRCILESICLYQNQPASKIIKAPMSLLDNLGLLEQANTLIYKKTGKNPTRSELLGYCSKMDNIYYLYALYKPDANRAIIDLIKQSKTGWWDRYRTIWQKEISAEEVRLKKGQDWKLPAQFRDGYLLFWYHAETCDSAGEVRELWKCFVELYRRLMRINQILVERLPASNSVPVEYGITFESDLQGTMGSLTLLRMMLNSDASLWIRTQFENLLTERFATVLLPCSSSHFELASQPTAHPRSKNSGAAIEVMESDDESSSEAESGSDASLDSNRQVRTRAMSARKKKPKKSTNMEKDSATASVPAEVKKKTSATPSVAPTVPLPTTPSLTNLPNPAQTTDIAKRKAEGTLDSPVTKKSASTGTQPSIATLGPLATTTTSARDEEDPAHHTGSAPKRKAEGSLASTTEAKKTAIELSGPPASAEAGTTTVNAMPPVDRIEKARAALMQIREQNKELQFKMTEKLRSVLQKTSQAWRDKMGPPPVISGVRNLRGSNGGPHITRMTPEAMQEMLEQSIQAATIAFTNEVDEELAAVNARIDTALGLF